MQGACYITGMTLERCIDVVVERLRAEAGGAELVAESRRHIEQWLALMKTWNLRMDLTAAKTDEALADVMLADTLVLAARVPLGASVVDVGSGVLAWVLLVVAEDLCYYAYHRVSHEVRLFWAGHVVHHSSRRYTLGTALRQSWTAPVLGMVFWMPLPLLGFRPEWVALMSSFSLLYQYWIHTETIGRLGPLEWVMNTPSHHRVHHGSNPQYIDRNHAGIFIVWDRLFGTFEPEGEKVVYGLTRDVGTYNPVTLQLHEFRAIAHDVQRASSFGEALRRMFENPSTTAARSASELRATTTASTAAASAQT